MAQSALRLLSACALINQNVLSRLDASAATATLTEAASSGLPLVVVPSFALVFTRDKLMKVLEGDNIAEIQMHLDFWDIVLRQDQFGVLRDAAHVRKHVDDQMASKKSDYPFAPVPDGYVVTEHVRTNGQRFERTKNAGEEKRSQYTIGVKSLQGIWAKASRFWGGLSIDKSMSVSASGYNNNVSINSEYVKVGCQRIDRYELEQVAVWQGWELPEIPAKAE